MSSFIGSYETDNFEKLLASEADILVLTPEKLDLLQRAQSDFLDNVRLFVLDEGHIIHDKGRGVKFELLLTRLKRNYLKLVFFLYQLFFPKKLLRILLIGLMRTLNKILLFLIGDQQSNVMQNFNG